MPCETCIKKKRKCGGERPVCANCEASGSMCQYSLRKPGPKPGQSKALEERLRKLEAIVDALQLSGEDMQSENGYSVKSFSVQSQQNYGRPMVPMAVPQSLDKGTEQKFNAQRQDLESIYLDRINDLILYTHPNQTQEAMRESNFFRFSCYAVASLQCPDTSVLPEFTNKLEMARMYFNKTISLLQEVYDDPSYHAILAFVNLLIVGANVTRSQEGIYCFGLGIKMALSIGLNSEEAYVEQGLSPERKELMRRVWWSLYRCDRLTNGIIGEQPGIRDEDCLCQLLTDSVLPPDVHQQDRCTDREICFMSSSEWYVVTPKNMYYRNYSIILYKILGKMWYLDKTKPKSGRVYLYRRSMLELSLDHWFDALPSDARNILDLIGGAEPPVNPQYAWHFSFILILYYSMKVTMQRATIFNNLKTSPKEAPSSASFKSAFKSACDCALIVACFMKHNRQFDYTPNFVSFAIFASTLILPLATRLELPPADLSLAESSYAILIGALTQIGIALNVGFNQRMFLEKLWNSKDPLSIAETLTRLKTLRGETESRPMEGRKQSEVSSASPASQPSPPTNLRQFESVPQTMFYPTGQMPLQGLEMQDPFVDLMMGIGEPGQDSVFGFQMDQN
ncbi:hypothetical protein EDD86DRAFT_198952 [Gorgonomyces haynaldii]|nr:hypothetical protein EDD86DRAFT_198952 [Gorgonomyces haynaldii]